MIRRVIAAATGAALAVVLATSAFAYIGGVASTIDASSPASATSGKAFTVSATVMDIDGNLLQDKEVFWTASFPSGAAVAINPLSSMTNADGRAVTTATITCDGCTVIFTATADNASGTTTTKVAEAGGLPNTSTANAGIGSSTIATLAALLAVLAGVVMMARQFVVSRR